jgi:hypothetical protein
MSSRGASLFVGCMSLAAVSAMLLPPETAEKIRDNMTLGSFSRMIISPAVAGDIEDRVNFFLTQHKEKVQRVVTRGSSDNARYASIEPARRSSAERNKPVPVDYSFSSSLSFSVPGEKLSRKPAENKQTKANFPSNKPKNIGFKEIKQQESSLPELDDTPTPRQYPVASIYEDPTLRYGDFVVMPSGVKIFKGRIKASHRARDFVAVRMSELPKRERIIISNANRPSNIIVLSAQPRPIVKLMAVQRLASLDLRGTTNRPRVVQGVTILHPVTTN